MILFEATCKYKMQLQITETTAIIKSRVNKSITKKFQQFSLEICSTHVLWPKQS